MIFGSVRNAERHYRKARRGWLKSFAMVDPYRVPQRVVTVNQHSASRMSIAADTMSVGQIVADLLGEGHKTRSGGRSGDR